MKDTKVNLKEAHKAKKAGAINCLVATPNGGFITAECTDRNGSIRRCMRRLEKVVKREFE